MTSPYQYITTTGVIIPDTSTILSSVQTGYQVVFGSNLIVTADTPQGVLITAEALAEVAVVNNNAALANQINPSIAGGVFLDAIMALTGIGRTPATSTLASAVSLTGVAGTVISEGVQAQTAAGDIFVSLAPVTLDAGGNGTVDFASQVAGTIPCAANSLTIIVTSVLGWETINNSSAGTLGTTTQSDQAARAYRSNTLAFQGVALAEAITSSLYATKGVTSLTFLENYNNTPAGMLVSVTSGGTLSGTIWGMSTTGSVIVGSSIMNFSLSSQTLPSPNPWPIAKYTTKAGNITLSGLSTQTYGDWTGSLTSGDIVLVKDQSTATQNGVYLANSSTWTRQAYNTTSSTILGSLGGISVTANSVYNCVNGGADLDVASALLENKSSGCGWNGGTSVSVVEPASAQTYTVLFDRPTEIGILVKVTTSNGNVNNIIQAVLDYANGVINGLAGFVVGAQVSPFEIASGIISEYPSYALSNVQISYSASPSYTNSQLAIAFNQIAVTQASYVTVVVT